MAVVDLITLICIVAAFVFFAAVLAYGSYTG
jgi:hypothetical protein